MFSSGYCDRCHPRCGEGTHYSRKRSFLSPRGHEEKGREGCAARGKTAAKRGLRGMPLAGRGRERLFSSTSRRERERGRGEDPPAKGSYYNKFVGDLRSGNNSELRVTLRMCLSLLLFKWEWKATSCAGCDLHLCDSLFPPLSPPVFSLLDVGGSGKSVSNGPAFLERWREVDQGERMILLLWME